ncbi:hypothetical protein [Novipirellula aureliae]|uniref:hypothetical protein n=1 Tax=Novipirellula aureliae TaxID=2527966 RepID=UPI0018CEC575|nr:hypothetical protein [Novipirellula aureliae]
MLISLMESSCLSEPQNIASRRDAATEHIASRRDAATELSRLGETRLLNYRVSARRGY